MSKQKRTEEELNKIVNDARNELWKIEKAREIEDGKKLIGKCFKYRNSFGGGSRPWWLYLKVTAVGRAAAIEKDCRGEVRIKRKEDFRGGHGYIEITQGQYTKSVSAILEYVKQTVESSHD